MSGCYRKKYFRHHKLITEMKRFTIKLYGANNVCLQKNLHLSLNNWDSLQHLEYLHIYIVSIKLIHQANNLKLWVLTSYLLIGKRRLYCCGYYPVKFKECVKKYILILQRCNFLPFARNRTANMPPKQIICLHHYSILMIKKKCQFLMICYPYT